MSQSGVVKFASTIAIGVASVLGLAGLAFAEEGSSQSVSNTTTTTVELNESSNSTVEVSQTAITSQTNIDSISSTSEQTTLSTNSLGDGQTTETPAATNSESAQMSESTPTSTTPINESQSSLQDGVVVNTTTLTESKTVLPIAAIAQKIISNNYSEQNSSSNLPYELGSTSTEATPVSPAIPVEPESPVGLLQQLSIILSQTPAASLIASLANSSVPLLETLTLFVMLLSVFAFGPTTSLFVKYLRNSGFSSASRGTPVAAFNPFATPLKMSFIAVPIRR